MDGEQGLQKGDMKVKELIEELSKADPEAEAILQKDSEGNGYSPLSGIDLNAVYIPDNTWSGMVYSTTWSAKQASMTKEEWEATMAKPKCVVLSPVN